MLQDTPALDMTAYLKDLEYLVNIDSGFDDPEGLNTVAAFHLANLLLRDLAANK